MRVPHYDIQQLLSLEHERFGEYLGKKRRDK